MAFEPHPEISLDGLDHLDADHTEHEDQADTHDDLDTLSNLDSFDAYDRDQPESDALDHLADLDPHIRYSTRTPAQRSPDLMDADAPLFTEEELETLAEPAAHSSQTRSLMVYTALGAGCAVIGRGIAMQGEEGASISMVGPLVLAAVIGAFTALGIGLVDRTPGTMGWRRMAFTTLSGAVIGTAGSFCLFVPMFAVTNVFLRLVVFSAAIAIVDGLTRRGTTQVALLAAAGLISGWLSSVVSWIDPYSAAPWAMAVTFGLMGVSVGVARQLSEPA